MLELVNVGLTLEDDRGKAEILKNINIKLEPNKIYVMTGPNGGGKSSIAKVIMGIYDDIEGKILMNGKDITNKNITERAKMGIGYAFQQPPRFKGMKVRDILKIASGGKDEENICEYLFDVGLCAQDYLDREINDSFSGGELKRVEIATLLARDLKVALFDEPEAGIDLWSFQKLTDTFRNLNKKYDMSLVIISHQERIFKLADHVIMVKNGEISEITEQEKILSEISELDNVECRCLQACEMGGKSNGIECAR